MSAEKAPTHAYEVRISIGANSREALTWLLKNIIEDFDRNDAPKCASGGWIGCYSVTTAKREISPDAYRAELEEWRKTL